LEPEAKRAPAGTTLTPADPLVALNCGLPSAPVACSDVAPEPEPEPAPKPVETKRVEPKPVEQKPVPHQHHDEAAPPDAKVIDPMCKMTIDPKTAAGGSLTLEGKQHWFCSTSCRRNFLAKNPGAK